MNITAKNFTAIDAAATAALNLKMGSYVITKDGQIKVFEGLNSQPAARYAVTFDRKTKGYTFTREF